MQNEPKGNATKIVMVALDLLLSNGYDLRKLPLIPFRSHCPNPQNVRTTVNSAAGQDGAEDVAADMLFERRPPGHEAKSHAIVDHRELAT